MVDQAYKTSVRRLIKIESNRSLKVELEDQSNDWSPTEGFELLESAVESPSIHSDEWKESFAYLLKGNAETSQYFEFFCTTQYRNGNSLDHDHRWSSGS